MNFRKILLIFPHNFLECKSGVHKRIYELCKYFKNRGFEIDQLAFKNYESKWNEEDYIDNKIINNYFFVDWITVDREIKERNNNFLNKIKRKFVSEKITTVLDLTSPSLIKEFKFVITKYNYDFVVIVYEYWAKLVDFIKNKNTKKIILIEDLLAKQQEVYFGKDKVDMKKMIKDEANKINKFDISISIGEEEYNLFKKLAPKPKHYLIPFFMDKKIHKLKNRNKNKKYDIGFIGFNNIHNVNGLNWFFKEIWPNIKPLKILIVGNVSENRGLIKIKHKNVKYTKYIKNLDDFYNNIKVTISPLLSGTGLKVKIIESFSYGVPCFFTKESVVGFPNKEYFNAFIFKNKKEFISKLNKILKNKKNYYFNQEKIINYFDRYFSKEKNYKKLDEVFN